MTDRKTKGGKAAASPGEVTGSVPAAAMGECAPELVQDDGKQARAQTTAAGQGPTTVKPTKAAQLEALLASPEGATLARLCDTLGWQSHTVRAAITRLRQAGHAVERSKAEHGQTVYRIAAPLPAEPASVATPDEGAAPGSAA